MDMPKMNDRKQMVSVVGFLAIQEREYRPKYGGGPWEGMTWTDEADEELVEVAGLGVAMSLAKIEMYPQLSRICAE